MRELKPRPAAPSKLRWLVNYVLQAPVFFASTAAFGSISLLASLFDKNGRHQHAIARQWGRFETAVSGARLTILHPERLTGQVAIYAANHLSYMDTPVIFGALPFQFRIVARHDLFKLPFIGWHLTRSGQVPVNVTNPRASIASLGSAVRTLKAGLPVFIFPEGGRSATGHPEPFLNGPAFMAIRAQVPIVPMALIGTHELLPIHTSVFHPVPITLAVGQPIATAGYTMRQIDELTEQVRDQTARLFYQHSYLKPPALEELEAQAAADTEPALSTTTEGNHS